MSEHKRLINEWYENGKLCGSIVACEGECQNEGIPSCDCKPVVEIRRKLAQYEHIGSPEEFARLKKQ